MCRFCLQHGDGKAWYLEAASYAADLDADTRRSEYLKDFVRSFPRDRETALDYAERLDRLPAYLRNLGRTAFTRSMMPNHFGQPVPIEECAAILDITTSVVRVPCPCRNAAGVRSDGYCLAVTTKPIDHHLEDAFRDYDSGPDTAKFERLSRAQALELLRRAEDEGLMHSVWTFITPFIGAICNCSVEAGCLAMRLTIDHHAPVMHKGHGRIVADREACTGCRACVPRCPFRALAIDPSDRRVVVDDEACYGCGVCRSACRADALTLLPRAADEGGVPAGAPAHGAASA